MWLVNDFSIGAIRANDIYVRIGSSVPPSGKELFTSNRMFLYAICLFVIFVFLHFGFEFRILILICPRSWPLLIC